MNNLSFILKDVQLFFVSTLKNLPKRDLILHSKL